MAQYYPLLLQLHYTLSRVMLGAALVMLAAAVYVGLIQHGDVTRVFRFITYGVFVMVTLTAALGLVMYAIGGRPREEVHLIYGAGAVLSLPFFIFVEVTAKKRPAMGSYIWGFAMLAAIIVRGIMTGR